MQGGFALPAGSASDVVDNLVPMRAWLANNGDWMATGRFESLEHFVVQNGREVARESRPILHGSGENYVGPFHLFTSNAVGDFLIAGGTDSTSNNQVLVLNGQNVVCRSGDPVDLDGNGPF